jgi:hypothetical protein
LHKEWGLIEQDGRSTAPPRGGGSDPEAGAESNSC